MVKQVNNAKIMYIILALAMVLFWVPYMKAMMVSSFLFLIAIILCSYYYKRTKETIYQSHYRWLSRTFWIGTGLLLPIAMSIMTWIVMKFGDMSMFDGLFSITATSDPAAIDRILAMASDPHIFDEKIRLFLTTNWLILFATMCVTCLPVIFWWFRRLWLGYKNLVSELPINNVTSWF